MNKELVKARNERRAIKQKLFRIRLCIEEGKPVPEDLLILKKVYESNKSFTSWLDFPDKWDIGDPMQTKRGFALTKLQEQNYERLFKKKLKDIVFLAQK